MNDEVQKLKARGFVSTLSLFFQSGYSALLGFIANVILTVLLSPAVFGIYITVLSIIALLNYFSDIGLAASLIQRRKIDEDDVKTAFTIQQFLVITVAFGGFLGTRLVVQFYNLPQEGIILYWALLLGFFLSSLKTIPSVFLERKIQYHKIVFVQVVENTTFYGSVIIFAIAGFNLLSFAFGVIARSIIGLILIYSISFWLPRVGISRKSIKHLVSFGIPFQSISLMALFKDELVNLFLGKIVGFQALGYIGWAKKWGEAPLRIIMESLSKVMFTLYARLQHDRPHLKHFVERTLRYQTMILLPAVLGFILVMPLLLDIIPRYEKWSVAVPLFYFFAIASFFSSFSTPFINLFNAVGKVKISFYFMSFWTAATWVLIIPLTNRFGMYGFPLTIFILSLSFIIVLVQAKRIVPFQFISSIYQFIISGIVMAVLVWSLSLMGLSSQVLFVISIAVGFVTYLAVLQLIFKINPVNEFITLLKK